MVKLSPLKPLDGEQQLQGKSQASALLTTLPKKTTFTGKEPNSTVWTPGVAVILPEDMAMAPVPHTPEGWGRRRCSKV